MPRSLPANHADMFLKVTSQRSGEIKGESNDGSFLGQIDLLDWSWSMSEPGAVGSTARSGRVLMRPLIVEKLTDRSTTGLLSAMYSNDLLSEVVLTVRKSGGAAALPYFVMKLKKARLTDFEVRPAEVETGATLLRERWTLSFRSVSVDYSLQGASGGSQGTSNFTGDTGDN